MSNCVFGGAGLLLVRDASRLALRAPALCAATTLSRYARRAVGLSGGRHSAPTVTTVVPQHVIASHGIERSEDFSHHCNDDDLRFFSSRLQTVVEDFKRGIAASGDQGGHVEHAADGCATAPDAAHSFQLSALEVIGCNADQSRDLRGSSVRVPATGRRACRPAPGRHPASRSEVHTAERVPRRPPPYRPGAYRAA